MCGESVWWIRGGCLDSVGVVSRVRGGCLECVGRVSGG